VSDENETPDVEETPVTEAEAVADEAPAEEAAPEAAAEEAAPEAAAEAEAPAEPASEAAAEEAPAEAEAPAEPASEAAAEPEAEPEPVKEKKKRPPRSNRPRRVRTTAEERAELRKKSAAARKRRRGESGGGEYVRTPAADNEQGTRRERRGVVTSNKGEKTITVRVDVLKAHPKYKKIMRRSMTLHAHDEQNAANIGDTVRVVETRPLSRTKRWRLVEIVEVAK
jgi:small subunit ribosomal protein S17